MRIRRIFVGGLAIFGGFVLLTIIIGVVLGWYYSRQADRSVPEKVVLEMDFEKGLVEVTPEDPFLGLTADGTPTVLETLQALERAADDPRVLGLVAHVSTTDMGIATIQEMRSAILAFRESGKPAIAFAETFGEFGPGNAPYYLATAFDKIYMQPSGDLGLTGLMYSTPFVRKTLDRLGITPRLDHRGEYKTAMNTFTEDNFTGPQRESTLSVMQSHFGQITKGIAQARGISEAEARAIINQGPFTASDAMQARLLDGLGYQDQIWELIKQETDPQVEFFSFSRYRALTGEEEDADGDTPTIALIYGVGAVHRGKSDYSPMDSGLSMGADTLTEAFRNATDADDVKAILFRVNSPGGSYIASDTIWREVMRTRQSNKPIIVSMGDVAASGGYFVSMAADHILAQPGTLTGSIGVFAGKPVIADFWSKLGITWDEVHTSEHSTMWSTLQDYTPEEWAIFQKWLDRVYSDFTGKVAEGRKMPVEKVQAVAQGRVWTGEDALANGLVDELGGFPEALKAVREAAGIPADAPVRLRMYPERKSALEVLAGAVWDDDNGESGAIASAMARMRAMIRPFVQIAGELGLVSGQGPLTMPQIDSMRQERR